MTDAPDGEARSALLRLAEAPEPSRALDVLGDIVDRSGWPRISVVGRDAARAAWSVLVGVPGERGERFQRQWVDELRRAVETGEAHPFHYAWVADALALIDGMGEPYATHRQFAHPVESLPPADELAAIDERRAGIGLGTLADGCRLARVHGWVWEELVPRLPSPDGPRLEVFRDRWGVPTDSPALTLPLAPFSGVAFLEEAVPPDKVFDGAGGVVSSDVLTDDEHVRVLRGFIRSWAEPADVRFLDADAEAARQPRP